MEPVDGIGLLKDLQIRWPGLKVILLTAHGTIPDAVQATQMGAFGFLTKPVDKQELLDQIQRALKISGFSDTTEEWRADIITRSAIMEERLAQAHMVAGTDARVLIIGESGTGKELLARATAPASPRRAQALRRRQLRDDFRGADRPRPVRRRRQHRHRSDTGAFQNAEGGTLLLDEIGDLPPRLQQKLLRTLQDEAVLPGGLHHRPPGQRARDLHHAAGHAAADGRRRVSRRSLLPAERGADRDAAAVAAARRHPAADRAFPGADRRRNRRAQDLSRRKRWNCWPRPTGPATCGSCRTWCARLRRSRRRPSFPVELVQQSLGGAPGRLPSFDEARDEFTRGYLSQILQITGGNVSQAARLAKRNRTDFYKLLARHQLVPEDFKQR